MKAENFCPLCGKKEGRFVKGLCEQCFQKKHKLVEIPEKIEFQQCKQCGKAKLFGKMQPVEKETLASFVEKKVKARGLEKVTVSASVEEGPNNCFAGTVFVKGIVDNVPLCFERDILISPKFFRCDACMKLQSQYHEAIIQLRGKDRQRLRKALPKLKNAVESQHKKDSLAVVTEISENKAGFDLRVGSKRAAQNAVRQMQQLFQAETKVSSKLLGKDKKGKLKRRFTFLLRV